MTRFLLCLMLAACAAEEPPDCGAAIESAVAAGVTDAQLRDRCEVSEGDATCAVVCNLAGYGLVCDADGCERRVRY